jgi:hypothetical protein
MGPGSMIGTRGVNVGLKGWGQIRAVYQFIAGSLFHHGSGAKVPPIDYPIRAGCVGFNSR